MPSMGFEPTISADERLLGPAGGLVLDEKWSVSSPEIVTPLKTFQLTVMAQR